MKKIFFILPFLFLFFQLPSRAQLLNKFSKLSRPEKIWVLAHPFKAKKAFIITEEVQLDVDSIKKSASIGDDNNGGRLDAFKHAYWMARLANKIGGRKAKKLGIAHEKGNKIQFKKHQLEENSLPDSLSSVMDLYNNNKGIEAVLKQQKTSKNDIQKMIMDELKNGDLRILKKDKQGNFLTCENMILLMNDWYGKWNIPKCLVPSNEG